MMDTRRALKILHEIGSAGIIGAIGAHLVLIGTADVSTPEAYAVLRHGIEVVTERILLPSLLVVLVSGVLGIGFHPPFHNAGWAWIKAATGVSMLEGTLGGIQGTARDAAALAAKVARGEAPASAMDDVLRHERGALWTILFLSIANIVLGVWRPRFVKPKTAPKGRPRTKEQLAAEAKLTSESDAQAVTDVAPGDGSEVASR
jgi:hypothetical protein